jgi:hypothetical protein
LDGDDDHVSLPARMMGGDITVCGHVRFNGFGVRIEGEQNRWASGVFFLVLGVRLPQSSFCEPRILGLIPVIYTILHTPQGWSRVVDFANGEVCWFLPGRCE